MAYEIFERTQAGRESRGPTINISKFGRIGLNKATTELLRKNAVEHILLLWDKDEHKIAFRPVNKKDKRSYSIIYGREDKYAMISGKSFLTHICYDNTETHTFDARWNEDENMLEFDMPAKYIKAEKSQSPGSNVSDLKQRRG